MRHTEEAPRSGEGKEQYVERLFASIAPKYDLLNSVLSFNRHKAWRRFAVRLAKLESGARALDVAAGTGDFSAELARTVGPEGRVVAVDFCRPMMDVGRRKLAGRSVGQVDWVLADAMRLPLASNAFDCATIGFGLRNVADVPQALSEMARVVKPGGRVVSLEINRPASRLFEPLWKVYFYGLLPGVARAFGGKREPYNYLPASVASFYTRQELSDMMTHAGLTQVEILDLALGAVCVHVGVKP